MVDLLHSHKASKGYPNRVQGYETRSKQPYQAVGYVIHSGNFSNLSRSYLVQAHLQGGRVVVNAKAMGTKDKGDIPRYEVGDRVVLTYLDGKTNQPLIAGKASELVYNEEEKVLGSVNERNDLPLVHEFISNPEGQVTSFQDYLQVITDQYIKQQIDLETIGSSSRDLTEKSDDATEIESELEIQGQELLKRSQDRLRRAIGAFDVESRDSSEDRPLPRSVNSRLLIWNKAAAEADLELAEQEVEEIEEKIEEQEAVNECLEQRNQEIEEGLKNLRNLGAGLGLDLINQMLPSNMPLGLETDEEGNINGINAGPFEYDFESDELSIAGESVKSSLANYGLSMLNETLPPYLQLCMTSRGTLEVGDYGEIDLESGDFDIGPFSLRDGEIEINDTAQSLVNNGLDELNADLPEPLQVSADLESGELSIGPASFDLNDGKADLDKDKLSGITNNFAESYLPEPISINLSSDFQSASVALGPIEYDSDDKELTVLGQTVFIDKSVCEGEGSSNQTELTENPSEAKEAEDSDKQLLPTVPPLSEKSSDGSNFPQTCGRRSVLKAFFEGEYVGVGRPRNAGGFYNFRNIGLAIGIENSSLLEDLLGVDIEGNRIHFGQPGSFNKRSRLGLPGYSVSSFPNFSVDLANVDINDRASNLAIMLAQYGVFMAGKFAKSLSELCTNNSIKGLVEFLEIAGNRPVKVVTYSIKAQYFNAEPIEVVTYSLDCQGVNDWLDMATASNNTVRSSVSPKSSDQDLDEFLDFPLSILDWASEVDPGNKGVYEGLRQGAFTDAMSELIYNASSVNIESTSQEYRRLEAAVARATFAAPRGHTLSQLDGEN